MSQFFASGGQSIGVSTKVVIMRWGKGINQLYFGNYFETYQILKKN